MHLGYSLVGFVAFLFIRIRAKFYHLGFWKLIQGILDPVVAAKVHFISGAQNLQKIIPEGQIVKELGGIEDWEYEYVEPEANENDKLLDVETRNTILAEREKLGSELFSLTASLVSNPQDYTSSERRDEVIKQLSDNYWSLDPYVRSKTLLDRTGVIQGGGRVDFYPAASPKLTKEIVITDEKSEATSQQVNKEPMTVVAN